MPTTTINPVNPGTQIHATEEAARLAAAAFEKATRAATEAQGVAAEAQTKAELERHQRRTAYLAELTRTYADNRDSLTTAIGAARAELEAAVAGDGSSVFATYRAWTRSVAALHALEVEIAEVRGVLGQPTRYPSDIQFSWQHDIGGIVDGLALDTIDDALRAARERRATFMSGGSQ
jgi:hypothetical protein